MDYFEDFLFAQLFILYVNVASNIFKINLIN